MKRVIGFDIAIWFVAATAGLLCGCSGGSGSATEPQQNTATPVAGSLGLPGPAELAGASQPREVSYARLSNAGSEFVPGYGQLIAAEDTDLRFSPDYPEGQSGLDGAAYAIYHFNLKDVKIDSSLTLTISWTTPPEVTGDNWLGLSLWGADSWRWFAGPAGGSLDLGMTGKGYYSHITSGDLYVAVVLTGAEEAVLQQLEFNGDLTPTAQLTADPLSGAPPLLVSFDASASSSPAGKIVKYEWDWDGASNGWVWEDTGATSTASHEYAEGGYTAWVRVTDEIGGQAQAHVSISSAFPPPIWAQFGHDPQHTHRSPYVGAQTNHLKWTFTTGDHISTSPAIGWDGTVYVSSTDGYLYAINPDGSLKWSANSGPDARLSGPVIGADGTLYIAAKHAKQFPWNVYALDPDGSLIWTSADEIGDDGDSMTVGMDGTLYVRGAEDGHPVLFAFNPDGSVRWTWFDPDQIAVLTLTGCAAIGADGSVYHSRAKRVSAINPDGSSKWTYYDGGFIVWYPPAIGVDGIIYVGSEGSGKLYAFNPDGSLKWQYDLGVGVRSSPAIGADGTIYLIGGSNLTAFSPDGSIKWEYPVNGYKSVPAIGADGTLYLGAYFHVYAINTDGSLKWSYQAGGSVLSSPAIGADGTVYVGCGDGKLYAFGP